MSTLPISFHDGPALIYLDLVSRLIEETLVSGR